MVTLRNVFLEDKRKRNINNVLKNANTVKKNMSPSRHCPSPTCYEDVKINVKAEKKILNYYKQVKLK